MRSATGRSVPAARGVARLPWSLPQVETTADDLDLRRFDDQRLVGQDEAEASPVGVGKARHQFVRIVGGDQ